MAMPLVAARFNWLAPWLPLDIAARLPTGIALVGGVPLLLGIGTRYLGIAMIFALFVHAMMDPRQTESVSLSVAT